MVHFDFVLLFLFLIIGALAGFLAGLLGIGGGLFTVPALLFVFQHFGFYSSHAMQMAVGTSLGAMIFTSLSSSIAHMLKKGVIWRMFLLLTPGVIVGTILGSLVADILPSKELEYIFAVLAILLGSKFLFSLEHTSEIKEPTLLFCLLGGFIIGVISVIMGIGGGLLTVPFLTLYQVPLKNSISTSAAVGTVIAVFGALFFILFGLDEKTPGGALGYIYLPACIIIGVVSTLTAQLGAKAAWALPSKFLQQIFGFYLIIVGLSMFIL